MATILDRIVEHKLLEVERRRSNFPVSALRDSEGYGLPRRKFCEAIDRSPHYGIIAEFKRKSPSQQDIKLDADAAEIARGYAAAGAAAISCITDAHFFGALPTDIDEIRRAVELPILRKDFLIDAYQLHEARAMGADAVLLIASCLSAQQLDELADQACELGLQVLCEVHGEDEVGKISPHVDVVGVNNRNLNDFSVSLSTSLALADLLPPGILRISESGIEDPQAVVKLRRAGYGGALIGTSFMRQPDPGAACAAFIRKAHEIEDLYTDAIA